MTSRPRYAIGQVLLYILLAVITSCATMPKPTLEINQPAPVFAATDLRGRSFSLSDYKGKNIVLVFYFGHR